MIVRLAAAVLCLILVLALGQFAWRAMTGHPLGRGAAQAISSQPPLRPSPTAAFAAAPDAGIPALAPPSVAVAAPLPACLSGDDFNQAAALNAASLDTALVAPFGRPETGWEVYLPLTAREIGSACPPQAPGFARALASWQKAHGLPASGTMDEPTLDALKLVWLRRRPFVAASSHGVCPPPPPDRLAWSTPSEGYAGKPEQLRPGALAAYRVMVRAARRESPAIAADPALLTIFSGYRDPSDEAAKCADGGCGGAAKANCSAHRTGLAMDLDLGSAPGFRVDSAADPNRLYMSRTAAYRWLVANAGRFGFVNYPFEPWHWEWTGEAP